MSIKTLSARLQYNGGDQLGRIRKQKLRSLETALRNDYNSRTVKTPNGRSEKCLINKNNLKADYDKEYISIKFDAGVGAGDVVECLEDGIHWMIYLPVITETAYLYSEIIRCRYTLDIEGVTYWIYLQSATETDIRWFQKSGINANELNLSGTVYIKKDKRTEHFFHRFDHLKIADRTWEVQVVDDLTVPGIIELELQEYYNNEVEELPSIVPEGCHEIMGRVSVEQDNFYGYQIRDSYYRPEYKWRVEGNPRVELVETLEDGHMCRIRVHDGAVRKFDILYGDGRFDYKLSCKIARECNGVDGPKTVYPYDIVEYKSDVKGAYTLSCGSDIAKIIDRDDTSCKVEITTSKKNKFTLYFNPDEFNMQVVTDVTIASL